MLYASVCVCMHARITFLHYYDSTCSPKLFTALEIQLLPPVPCMCVAGAFCFASLPADCGLMVTTLLLTSGLHAEERTIGENGEAGTQLPYGAVDNLLPVQQNHTGEGWEEGGKKGRRRRRRKKKNPENPENSSPANVVKLSGQSSFAREEQRRKRTLNEKKQERSVARFLDTSSVLEGK